MKIRRSVQALGLATMITALTLTACSGSNEDAPAAGGSAEVGSTNDVNPQSRDALPPGVPLPRPEREPTLGTGPDAGWILLEGGEQPLHVVHGTQRRGARDLRVERRRDPVSLGPLEAPPHGALASRSGQEGETAP